MVYLINILINLRQYNKHK